MKPGDLIMWYYNHNNEIVAKDEKLLSNVMKCWVPIAGVSILLYKNNETYGWINSKGLFHACVGDIPWQHVYNA